jgi:hypothetical protein
MRRCGRPITPTSHHLPALAPPQFSQRNWASYLLPVGGACCCNVVEEDWARTGLPIETCTAPCASLWARRENMLIGDAPAGARARTNAHSRNEQHARMPPMMPVPAVAVPSLARGKRVASIGRRCGVARLKATGR